MANIDFPTSPTVGQQYTFAGVTYTYTTQGVWSPGGSISVESAPQGRLTLQNGAPVMITNTTGVTAIFYTPYVGDRIPIWNGLTMVMTKFQELIGSTIDTTKNPAVVGIQKLNDWFVWNDNGTVRLSHGPDWTNDTTRSAGTDIVRKDGIWTNAAPISGPSFTPGIGVNKGTYVGTTRSDVSAHLQWVQGTRALGGGAAGLSVWNAYNRVDIFTEVSDSTATWTPPGTYAITGVAPTMLNNSSGNRITFVSGLAEEALVATIWQPVYMPSAVSTIVGLCFDDLNVWAGPTGWFSSGAAANELGTSNVFPACIGTHFIQAVFWTGAAGDTFYGDGSVYLNGLLQQGLQLTCRM